jgi:hypothetical protein
LVVGTVPNINQRRRTAMDVITLTEQLQENLLCYFDGMSEEVLDQVCRIVIDTIKGEQQ